MDISPGKKREDDMAWDYVDFAVFGAMMLIVGYLYALVSRKAAGKSCRAAFGVALGTAFVLVWINGAVGIIGDEDNDANMFYFGVLAVGALGAAIARFQPPGMVWAMCATASAQAAVAVIALVAGLGSAAPAWPGDILVLTVIFVALWLTSAWLFRYAAIGPGHT
jgi:hypothetical protein